MVRETEVLDCKALRDAPRLLMECELKPLQGDRFQPTGFADLGPARYTLPDRTEMLLVESAQSVANRMELTCWDSVTQDLIEPLSGLPYIRVETKDGQHVTNSLLEAHRINSEYIVGKKGDKSFKSKFSEEIEHKRDRGVNRAKFFYALLKYDFNSLLHGCFLEEIDGRLRTTRAVSGFVEATGVRVAESGGVKNNIVEPSLKAGEGNVPFHRTEFVAERITAYFNLDVALLRGYGLPDDPTNLMIALALFKIRRFLSTGLRLRTACDLEPLPHGLRAIRPNGLAIPEEQSLLERCRQLIGKCKEANLFATPSITSVRCSAEEATGNGPASDDGPREEEPGGAGEQ
jgi:CRISPR-associated protein Csb1